MAINDQLEFNEKYFEIIYDFEFLPCSDFSFEQSFLKYLDDEYQVRPDYSKTTNSRYLANHCEKCQALQGDYFLFQVVNGPFFIWDPLLHISEISLKRIPLEYDIPYQSKLMSFDKKVVHLSDENIQDIKMEKSIFKFY